MKAQESTINIALPVSGFEEWIQRRITEAIEMATKAETKPLEFVSQKELCKRIAMSAPTVIALRKKGIIEGVCIGNKWRFEVSEVWQALKAHQAKQAKQLTSIK